MSGSTECQMLLSSIPLKRSSRTRCGTSSLSSRRLAAGVSFCSYAARCNLLQVQFTPLQHTQNFCHPSFAGICKIVPPVTPATPAAMVICFHMMSHRSHGMFSMQALSLLFGGSLQVINPPGGKKFSFTTRQQSVKQHTWDNFDSARFYQSDRCVAFNSLLLAAISCLTAPCFPCDAP